MSEVRAVLRCLVATMVAVLELETARSDNDQYVEDLNYIKKNLRLSCTSKGQENHLLIVEVINVLDSASAQCLEVTLHSLQQVLQRTVSRDGNGVRLTVKVKTPSMSILKFLSLDLCILSEQYNGSEDHNILPAIQANDSDSGITPADVLTHVQFNTPKLDPTADQGERLPEGLSSSLYSPVSPEPLIQKPEVTPIWAISPGSKATPLKPASTRKRNSFNVKDLMLSLEAVSDMQAADKTQELQTNSISRGYRYTREDLLSLRPSVIPVPNFPIFAWLLGVVNSPPTALNTPPETPTTPETPKTQTFVWPKSAADEELTSNNIPILDAHFNRIRAHYRNHNLHHHHPDVHEHKHHWYQRRRPHTDSSSGYVGASDNTVDYKYKDRGCQGQQTGGHTTDIYSSFRGRKRFWSEEEPLKWR